MPSGQSRRREASCLLQFVSNLRNSIAVQIHIKDQPDGFRLFRINHEVLTLPVIAKNISGSKEDTFFHCRLHTRLYTDGSLSAFVLSQRGHNRQPQFSVSIKGFNIVIDKEDLYAVLP